MPRGIIHPLLRAHRGWALIGQGGWVKGWYIRGNNCHFIIPQSSNFLLNESPFDTRIGDLVIKEANWYMVDKDSIGACMGFQTKYKETIYEGDILKVKDNYYEVYWMELANQYRLVHYDCRTEHDKSKDINFARVGQLMGNQFEDPELLRTLQKRKEEGLSRK